MYKAHQKALSAAAALEGEIKRLSRMRAHPRSGVRLRSQDCQRSREGWKKRQCQVSFMDELAPSQSASPKTPMGKEEFEGKEANLGDLTELKPAVASFLWGSPETSDDEGKKTPPEPTVSDSAEWMTWKAKKCNTPNWWMELSTVPGGEDTREAGEAGPGILWITLSATRT